MRRLCNSFAVGCGLQHVVPIACRRRLSLRATTPLWKPKRKVAAAVQRRVKASRLPPPHAPADTDARRNSSCDLPAAVASSPPPVAEPTLNPSPPPPSPASPPSSSPPQARPLRPSSTPRRTYAASSEAVGEQLASLKRELAETRLQLAAAHSANTALHSGVLSRLAETSRAADVAATTLRYTGMALRAAQDCLEVELRRLLAIGLTADAVDAAAIEAGARQYVRQNIGYHAQHVSEHPASATDPLRASELRDRPPALPTIGASTSAPGRSP